MHAERIEPHRLILRACAIAAGPKPNKTQHGRGLPLGGPLACAMTTARKNKTKRGGRRCPSPSTRRAQDDARSTLQTPAMQCCVWVAASNLEPIADCPQSFLELYP